MQGFKGLIPKNLLLDQAFQPLFKKAEDQRKATQLCIDFFQLIAKFFDSYSGNLSKLVSDYESSQTGMVYYETSCLLFENISKETMNLTQNTKGSFKQLTTLCNTIFHDFSKVVLNFQTSMRKYQEYEQVIGQLSKKYYRTHKSMLTSIDAYKSSFSDVNIIYNLDEKLKRYNVCEKTFKTIEEEYESINKKLEGLTNKKMDIIKYYGELPDQFAKVTKVIGSKIIGQTKNFVGYFCTSYKIIITNLAQQKFALEKQKIPTFFKKILDHSTLQYFNQQNLKPKSYIPLFLQCHSLIKDQFLEHYNKQMLNYLKQVESQVQKRKIVLKKLADIYSSYIKLIDKSYIAGVKEILIYFEKMKKKLGQSFGNRLVSFLKSVNSFFQLSAGVNEKLVKTSNASTQSVQSYINEESKLLKLFGEELKNNIQKFIGKKELKKLKEDQFTQEQNFVNYRAFRKEISQKAEFIKHLIVGFHEKMEINCDKLKRSFGEIVNQINMTINEFFSLCLEYQQMYFGVQEFQTNFKKYQDDIEKVLQKQKKFFLDLPFNALKSDNTKITFDGQYSKVLDFKKIKKPYKSEEPSLQTSPGPASSQDAKSLDSSDIKRESFDMQKNQQAKKNIPPPNRQTLTKDQKQLKNIDFLIKKIKFKQNQHLIKTYNCAYAEKIVLQGKLYITNQRICFGSNFNSSNLFFGTTFIEIPKEDIKKIEKKKNALFIDNTLSFTTVNGEVAFTSLFARNEAYDLVCKTFEFNFEDQIYEFEEKEPQLPQFLIELEEDDDMKQAEIQQRVQEMQPLMNNFAYSEAASLEMEKQGFNALKIFKVFYGDSEIVINKRTYPSFLHYIKNTIAHKDLDIDPWDIELDKILNKSNLKSGAPLKTVRKVRCTVPVSAAGIPFMPKTAKSQEIQTLLFYSKHRFILFGEISTSGAPYTDTFNVQLKTEVTSDQSGKCKFSIGLFVNFIKNTMMKAVIESKSQQQTGTISKTWMNEISQYFTNLQKMRNAKSGNANPLQEAKQQLELKTKQVEELSIEKEKLVSKIEDLQKKMKIRQYALIGAAVLIFMLAIIALF